MSVKEISNFIRIDSILVLVLIFQNIIHFAKTEPVCGTVTLTYFQTGNNISAKLDFIQSPELQSFRWIHFFSNNKPDFEFGRKHSEASIIISDLNKSNEGMYNVDCTTVNSHHLFSENNVTIQKPYLPVMTRKPSTEYIPSSSTVTHAITSKAVKTDVIATSFITKGDFKTTAGVIPVSTSTVTHAITTKAVKTDVIATSFITKGDFKTTAGVIPVSTSTVTHAITTKAVKTDVIATSFITKGDLKTTVSVIPVTSDISEQTDEELVTETDVGVTRAEENITEKWNVTSSFAADGNLTTTDTYTVSQISERWNGETKISPSIGVKFDSTTERTQPPRKQVENVTVTIGVAAGGILGAVLVVILIVVVVRKKMHSNSKTGNEGKQDKKDQQESLGTRSHLFGVGESNDGVYYTVTDEPRPELQTFSGPKLSKHEMNVNTEVNIEKNRRRAANDKEFWEVQDPAAEHFRPRVDEDNSGFSHEYDNVSEVRPNESFSLSTRVPVMTVDNVYTEVEPEDDNEDNLIQSKDVFHKSTDYENVPDVPDLPIRNVKGQSGIYVNLAR